MTYDYLIRNGRVIDPLRNIDRVENVLIRNSKIVEAPVDEVIDAGEIIDASGCIVTPGLIDFHAHLANRTSQLGLNPDIYFTPNGVTAAVDAGSAGSSGFESMVYYVCGLSSITAKAYMNISPSGIISGLIPECLDPVKFEIKRMEYLFERYSDYIMGLKVRVGKDFSLERRYEPLKSAMELGERFNCPYYAHIIDPEDSLDEAMPYFRTGDVFAHCYQGVGAHSIIDTDGKIRRSVLDARERGVIMDSAQGVRGRNLDIAKRAVDQGFWPDVISADACMPTAYKKTTFSLLRPLMEFYSMGMPLIDVIRACTQTPAKLMGMEGLIGTLAPGAQADVAILKLVERPVYLDDPMGNKFEAGCLFVPQMTIKAGQTLYRQIEFMY